MGVNDLVEQYGYSASDADSILGDVARTAWHLVSEPPTEEDGDKQGYILIWTESGLDLVKWDEEILEVPEPYVAGATHWARIHDVVLLPGD